MTIEEIRRIARSKIFSPETGDEMLAVLLARIDELEEEIRSINIQESEQEMAHNSTPVPISPFNAHA